MGTPAAPNPFDPADEAGALADLFNSLSDALDDYRLADHDPPLTIDQKSRLKDESQALEDRAHFFTAEAIGATLQAIQGDLDNIKSVTAQARVQLKTLKLVDKVINVATSALSLATAIAAGNPLSILAAAKALGQTIQSG